jgi:hypothetical protein
MTDKTPETITEAEAHATQQHTNASICPNCGYCFSCGRARYTAPHPQWFGPYWWELPQVWCNTGTWTGNNY